MGGTITSLELHSPLCKQTASEDLLRLYTVPGQVRNTDTGKDETLPPAWLGPVRGPWYLDPVEYRQLGLGVPGGIRWRPG